MAYASFLTTTALFCAYASLVTSMVVDLTHVLGSQSIFWPGQPPFTMTSLVKPGDQSGWEMNAFSMGEHGGTHVDAPSHAVKGRWRLHQVPANHLVGPGVVIDVRIKAYRNIDYLLSPEDIQEWETNNGPIPDGAVVLMRTGWYQRHPDANKVFNTSAPQDPRTFHFPAVNVTAAKWLTHHRNIIALGTDTPSPDSPTTSSAYPVHQHLLAYDVIILENVANLGILPAKGATIVIGALKLENGSGGPARIMALIDSGSGSAKASFLALLSALTLALLPKS